MWIKVKQAESITKPFNIDRNSNRKEWVNSSKGVFFSALILPIKDHVTTYIGETGRNLSTRLTGHKRTTRNGDVNNHISEHHLQTKHQINWYSATCITYCTDYYERLTLGKWFTKLEQTPLNRSQQLPAPYKRLIGGIKQN